MISSGQLSEISIFATILYRKSEKFPKSPFPYSSSSRNISRQKSPWDEKSLKSNNVSCRCLSNCSYRLLRSSLFENLPNVLALHGVDQCALFAQRLQKMLPPFSDIYPVACCTIWYTEFLLGARKYARKITNCSRFVPRVCHPCWDLG